MKNIILKYLVKFNIESLLPLKMYDNKTTNEYNIDLETNNLLTREECQNLIYKNFSENFNYYQKMIFIHAFGTQFKMFY